MYGHFHEQQIDNAIALLSRFKKNFFKYSEIEMHYNNFRSQYDNIDLEQLLEILFDFSLIGNKWYNTERKRDYYTWVYREDIVPKVDFNKEFVVHLGLRKALSI